MIVHRIAPPCVFRDGAFGVARVDNLVGTLYPVRVNWDKTKKETMGYDVYLSGQLKYSQPLTTEAVDEINAFLTGEGNVVKYSGAPDRWGLFASTTDELDGPEDSCLGPFEVWLDFIIQTFLLPNNVTVTGGFEWNGEESGDQGYLAYSLGSDGEQLVQCFTVPQDYRRWDKSPIEVLIPKRGSAVEAPMPFNGTEQQRAINLGSHTWNAVDNEGRECGLCGSREYHVAATYPCGVNPPRQTILV